VDVLTHILAFIVGFLASYFAQWPTPPEMLWRIYFSRKRRERKCYTMPRGKIYIVPSSSSDEVNWYLSEHDMACVEAVVTMLRGLGYREGNDFHIFFQHPHQDTVPESIRTENLVLVCGPSRNKLVESIFCHFPNLLSSVRLALSLEPAFTWQGNRYVSENTRDYAIMAIKRNPYNSKRKLVLLFGLKGIGTKGVGSFYASPGWAQARAEIADQLETRLGEIEVLLSVDYTADYREITRIAPVTS
jgi:hypothetical protein